MDLPKFSCSTTQCVGSGSQLSLVFDPRPVAYLEHCFIYMKLDMVPLPYMKPEKGKLTILGRTSLYTIGHDRE